MNNIILGHRAMVAQRLGLGFGVSPEDDDALSKGEEANELEKARQRVAHTDGMPHPTRPDLVWSSSAAGGKGDWRKRNDGAGKKKEEEKPKNSPSESRILNSLTSKSGWNSLGNAYGSRYKQAYISPNGDMQVVQKKDGSWLASQGGRKYKGDGTLAGALADMSNAIAKVKKYSDDSERQNDEHEAFGKTASRAVANHDGYKS